MIAFPAPPWYNCFTLDLDVDFFMGFTSSECGENCLLGYASAETILPAILARSSQDATA